MCHEKKEKSLLTIIGIIVLGILISFILSLFIRFFFLDFFIIEHNSMVPSLNQGDIVLVEKFSMGIIKPINLFNSAKNYLQRYNFTPIRNLRKNDIIVFYSPDNSKKNLLIKRIMGIPKDKLEYESIIEQNFKKTINKIIVPQNMYFVVGDNLAISEDSRKWGFLSTEKIIGRVIYKF
ncbi:MAG: signal peptidase I [Spirochaetia bacterium]|nr:signal peptidase I [Spirochaetia bacterium]